MIAARVETGLSPDVIERLMLYGRQIDKELEKIIGKPALFAMSIAISVPAGLVMHRLANTNIEHARQMFELASATPIEEQGIQRLQEH